MDQTLIKTDFIYILNLSFFWNVIRSFELYLDKCVHNQPIYAIVVETAAVGHLKS